MALSVVADIQGRVLGTGCRAGQHMNPGVLLREVVVMSLNSGRLCQVGPWQDMVAVPDGLRVRPIFQQASRAARCHNGFKTDNRRANLRFASQATQNSNRGHESLGA